MIGRREATLAGRAKVLGLTLAMVALFALVVATSAQAVKEYESNDSRETAYGPLAGATTYTATFETENDYDWYLLYVRTYSQIEVSGSMLPGSSCSGSIRFTELLDADGNELTSFSIGRPNEVGRLNVTLNAGRYYLKFRNIWSECNGDRYNFRVDPAAAITTSRECGEAIVARDAVGPQLAAVNQELAENAAVLATKAQAVHAAKAELRQAAAEARRLKGRLRGLRSRRKRNRVRAKLRQVRGAVQRATEELDDAKERRQPVWQEKVNLETVAQQHNQQIAAANGQIAAHC